jgi:predicted transcriptional regulator
LRTQLSKLSISREASPVVHSESDLRREYERGKIESEQKSSRKVSELTEEVQTLNSTLTRIESEKASLLSKIAELNDQLLKKDPVESEEGKAKALLSCVEYAADMLAQFPDDQSYSAKDVLRIFKISARKVLSKQEADASAPKTHVEDESNGESSKKSE